MDFRLNQLVYILMMNAEMIKLVSRVLAKFCVRVTYLAGSKISFFRPIRHGFFGEIIPHDTRLSTTHGSEEYSHKSQIN